ncbi:MAG: 4Fe-4S dicluster domain-containing protein [Nautiliaceae bacterium]
MIDKSKRNFFRRVSSPLKSYIFPPYYEKKEDFLKCIECEDKDCLNACNEKIISIENEMPIIKFDKNGCTYCNECAKACKIGVLSIEKKRKIEAEIIINPKKCIAWNQTICFSCQDICQDNAIQYKGMFFPIIDEDKCTSCGFCISVCPTNAIEIKTL